MIMSVFKCPKCINVSFGRIVLVVYRLLVQPDYIRKYIVEEFFKRGIRIIWGIP